MDLSTTLIEIWHICKEWYWIPVALIYISIIFTILIENNNPTKTIAWILVIVFIPIIGIILYYFFGQSFKKNLYFKKVNKNYSKEFIDNWKKFNQFLDSDLNIIENKIGGLVKVYKYLNYSFSSQPSLDNKVELLINGEEKFPKFLELIKNAKHHIHIEYYIFEEDKIGKEIINILIKKAAEGVEVRITTDDFGSPKLNKIADKIFKNTSVKYKTFLPVRFNSLANSNFRNHRKILIVDCEYAIIGGINVSDKYINTIENKLFWRDTSVCIQGNAVNTLQFRFWMDWRLADGDDFNIKSFDYLKLHDKIDNGAIVGFGFTSPGSRIQSAMDSMILAISLAKRNVRLTTPYFIPNEQFKTALIIAANSGVEVELIIPKVGDSLIVQEASLSYTKKLMEQGVKVYLYEKGFIHAKTISIDEDLAFVGTVNLDNRSFGINFELTAIINDTKLIVKLNEQYEIDKSHSSLLTIKIWENTSVIKRALASICRLLAPIL